MNLGSSRDVSILCAFDSILSKHAVGEDADARSSDDGDENDTCGPMVGGDGGGDVASTIDDVGICCVHSSMLYE